jgi:hypothetical protein
MDLYKKIVKSLLVLIELRTYVKKIGPKAYEDTPRFFNV